MKKLFLTLTMLLFAFTGTMKAQSAMPNRDIQTLIEEGFESGSMPDGWTQEGNGTWAVGTGDYSTSTGAATGSYNAKITHSSTGNNTYFITPAMDLSDATSATISCKYINRSWAGDTDGFGIYYRVDGGAWNELFYTSSAHSTWTATGDIELTDFAANYQIGFRMKDSYGYGVGLDDVVVTADIAAAPGGDLTTTPDALDLGYRPNGAWMAPYVFTINGSGTTVTALDFSGNYFTYDAELPATLTASRPLEVGVSTGTAEEGAVNSTMTVLFDGRDAQQFPVTAYAYNPVDGDVFETAIEVPMEPQTEYTEVLPTGIYKNYDLRYETTDEDAVYKVTFNDDVLFYAGTQEGVVELYTEDFKGEGGPMADNYYEYEGPTVNPGPMAMWFNYDYTGTNTWYGTSAGGGMMWGYRITAEMLQELGLGNCAITTVESAARNSADATFYDFFILKGGETPDINNMVYYQAFEGFTPGYYFTINLDEPQFLGDDENLWVMFYSDSPYAAYCGRYPVDTQNGKIWYTLDYSTWYSSTSYTPEIYTRFLELPTGREVTVDLGSMKIRESKPAAGQIAEANGDVMGVAKAQMRSRDAQELTVHDGTATNSYVPVYGFYGDAYNKCEMVYPAAELSDMEGGTINSLTFYASTPAAEAWTGTFQVFMAEVADATISDFAGPGTVVYEGLLNGTQSSMTITFDTPYEYNGGNLLIGVYQTATGNYKSVTWVGESVTGGSGSGYNYNALSSCTFTQRNFLPKTTFSYEAGGTPEPPTPGEPFVPSFEAQIDGMYVPAGTYYVVATGDVLHMAIDAVPVPEPAIIWAPYDGETNVTAPYLAEWTLGDYTTEMQVLVGTQYPPQTILIDWTDYLVESAFIMDLEPNQSYFMQVNARNAAGTTMGEIIAFTTPIDGVTGLEVADDELYPGDAALLTWDANRSFKGYNVYVDGVKWNESLITTNEYAVEGLEYNMLGYDIQVSAVYDAGESELSEEVTVYMTGVGTVSGHVYDIDEEHPIAGATVMYIGADEYEEMSEAYFVTDEEGFYSGEILAGIYAYGIATEGYDSQTGADVTEVAYMDELEGLDIYTHEFYYPLEQITATDEGDDVLVEWSWTPAELIIDFETGDFSQYEFTQPAQYPWAITTGHAHEGTYAIKSTCEGVASGLSQIEATVDVPYDGKMGFWVSVSSESNYDKFHFYIDGVEQGTALSGTVAYAYKEYDVTEGTHTYKWTYQKDSSVNSGDDCAYVDDITMYRYVAPLPPVVGATVYDFEDGTLQGWTNIDADGDGNVWVSSTNPGIYHNSGVSLAGTGHDASQAYVISGSYANQTGQALTPDNYLVSPLISAENGAQIQFYACAQDASYAAEHFGVAVSTTTATAGAFTTIQEWTMTAKGTQGRTVESEHDVRGLRQGNWYLYTVDLSSYAGQDIYVAIRHFNCTDMFILNVDDITLASGGSKTEDRGNRSLVSYNLYRRNNIDLESVENPELIAEGIDVDVYEYIDNEWATLDYGEWQWGIAATYAGYSPLTDRNRETATYGFEGGSLEGWTGIVVNSDGGEWIHSNYNLGGYDYTTLAHTGSGFAMCYSYVDYDGPYNTNAYLVSPQKYSVDANSTLSFWADNANDSYPENFSVCVSTAANPTAADFTEIWSGGAKGKGGNDVVRHSENRYQNWRSHEISLAAYAGQEIWIAFHDVNYDQYEIWIDDVTINYAGGAPVPPTPPTPGPTGDGISEILWSNVLDKDMVSTVTFNLSLNNGQSPAGIDMEITGIDFEEEYVFDETGTMTIELRKGVYALEIEPDGYAPIDDALVIDEDEMEFSYTLVEQVGPVAGLYVSPTGWVKWEGVEGGVTPTPPTPPVGDDVTIILTAGDVWGDGSGYQMLLDDTHSLYGTTIPTSGALSTSCSGNEAIYAQFSHKIPVNADGACSTSNIVINNSVSITIPAGTYDWCITNPTPGDRIWIAAGNGNVGGRQNDYTFEAGNVYEFTVSYYGGNDGVDVTVTGGAKNSKPSMGISTDCRYEEIAVSRAPMKYVVKLDGVVDGETTFPGFQHNVEGMEEGSVHTTAVRPVYVTGNGDWMEYTWTYTACDNFNGVSDLAAAEQGNDVKLTWTMPGAPGPGPQPGAGWTEGFESGMPEGWSVIDGNNDGYTWCLTSAIPSTWTYYASLTLDWYRTGTNAICSGSYINGVGAITPNEYLVMGQQAIGNGTTFSFWAAATDASYPADHFGVAVSDNGTDWTMVQEWTLTGKGSRNGGRESRDGNGAKLGTWYQYSVDLSAYAGNKYLAIRHFNCTDQYIMCVDDLEFGVSNKGNRDMWDYVASFTGTSAGQQAVCTDGEYIYTASWQTTPTGGHTFYQYTMDGTFVEGFEIAGATGIRDITTDGEYFYGTSGGAQIFIMDFTTRTLVGTINCSGLTSRHISYDPERDGFWSGNWSTLALYSRTGALIQNGPAPTSAYGSAYYKDADDVEHLFLFCQPSSDAKVYDYNITTNTISGPVFDFAATPGFDGIAGGCFIGEYEGNTCWFGNSQQDPNLIGIFELEAGTGPVPPTPVEGILGAMIFQDGEPIAFVEGNPTQYVVEGAASYDATYGVRVVYGGEYDVTYYAMSCMEEVDYSGTVVPCNPVANLTAEDYTYNGNHGALVSWTEPAGAISYKIYVDGELLGSLTGQPIFINFEGTPAGTYTIGVVAVYAECESEMVTVDFLWTPVSVDEISANTNIYPNPTHDNVTIEAQGMRHITVVSALGQVVYDADIEADMTQLNLGQFKAGLYMVRIDTENGTVVKRVSVVK